MRRSARRPVAASNSIQETDQLLAAAGLLQLADRLGFDLANTFTRHFENVTNFLKRIAVAVAQSVAELDNFAFAIAEGLEDLGNPAAKHLLRCTDRGIFGTRVGKQIAEMAILAIADRPVEA